MGVDLSVVLGDVDVVGGGGGVGFRAAIMLGRDMAARTFAQAVELVTPCRLIMSEFSPRSITLAIDWGVIKRE